MIVTSSALRDRLPARDAFLEKDQIVGQLVAVARPRREMLGEHRAGPLDRLDEAVGELAGADVVEEAGDRRVPDACSTFAAMPASATISA